jgi:hypothetical protein
MQLKLIHGSVVQNIMFVVTFFWLPFSIGGVDYFRDVEFAGLGAEYIFILIAYLVSVVIFFHTSDKRIGVFSFLWVFLIGISFIFYDVGLSNVFQFFSLVGALFLASAYLSVYSFHSFISVFDRVFKFWSLLSVFYFLIIPSQSFEYVNDVFSVSSFYGQKNVYGRFLMLALFFHCLKMFYFSSVSISRDFRGFLWLGLYFFLLYISSSKSALLLSVLIIIAFNFMSSNKTENSIRLAFPYVVMLIFTSVFLFLNSDFVVFRNVGSALDCMELFSAYCIPGTGRFTIWDSLIFDVFNSNKELYGYGFGVYFSTVSKTALSNIGLGGFIPNDPHNGYVEFFANFGYIGIFILLSLLIIIPFKLLKYSGSKFKFLFVFYCMYVIANITESYFLKTTNIYIVLFLYFLGLISERRLFFK